MHKTIGVIAAALAIAAFAVWSNPNFRADAALQMSGTVTDAQINVLALTNNTHGLHVQEYPAF